MTAGMVSFPQMNAGVKISGAAHIGLILWAVLGGLFSFERDDAMEFSEVTLISGEQFAAMMAAGSSAPDVAETPAAPETVPEEAAAPETPAPEDAPEAQETPETAEPVAPETEPQVDETFETPEAEVTPVAPSRPDQPEGASVVFAPENPPAPQAAPRVAPRPSPRPEPEANVGEEIQQAARREEAPEAPPVPEAPEETTAPEETGTVIETEATEEAGGTEVSLAPAGTPRPQRRPNRPAPTPAPEPREETPSSDATSDAIAAALAEANAEAASSGQGSAPTGPPLTSGEKDALRISVQQCWNVGSLSTDALRTTVTVYVLMNEDGKPDNGSIRMLDYSGGPEAAANQAYEAARRAIIRCGSSGFDLPAEKYSHWREIEMVFNPENMRIR